MLPKELHQLKYEAIIVVQGSVHLVKKTQERKVQLAIGSSPKNYHTHLEEEYANYREPPDGADNTSQ
ncbi:UNVERIFIED_CONTAM: hypothetical protein NCL1_48445 [Trichonephila clavipes]